MRFVAIDSCTNAKVVMFHWYADYILIVDGVSNPREMNGFLRMDELDDVPPSSVDSQRLRTELESQIFFEERRRFSPEQEIDVGNIMIKSFTRIT